MKAPVFQAVGGAGRFSLLLGEKELAVEVKGAARVHEGDIRGLQALLEDGPVKKCCLVCLEKQPRRPTKEIEVPPWELFIERLWGGEFDSPNPMLWRPCCLTQRGAGHDI